MLLLSLTSAAALRPGPLRPQAVCRRRAALMSDDARGTPLGDLADKLSIGERIGQGTKNSWVNPAYWNRQFVTASHIANNVPNGSTVLELGKDAKNLYYVPSPEAMTLVVPPSNLIVEQGPIREAAAKLRVPFSLFTETPLDAVPLTAASFDAALLFDMLDGAPEQAAYGAVSLLANALKPGGVLLFAEREGANLPAICADFNLQVASEAALPETLPRHFRDTSETPPRHLRHTSDTPPRLFHRHPPEEPEERASQPPCPSPWRSLSTALAERRVALRPRLAAGSRSPSTASLLGR